MDYKEAIALELLSIKAVSLRTNPPYTWTSGIKAPIYTDNRLIISFPDVREKVIDGFKRMIKDNDLEFDVIAGTATAAVPFASFLAWELKKPLVYIRHKAKEYGASKQIEGTMPEGARVLIVEDLISTGGSAIRSVEACRNEYKADVVGVIAVFNYQMHEAVSNFSKAECSLHTLSNFSTLVEVAAEQNYLRTEDKEKVLQWAADPEGWYNATY
ncbi:orotate phosphoribosyltransferase [Candidatus Woesearchaeota archaeon CG10_big_fil_rev_8_21_14_0_10_45_16]|nr:MAG: orotate phosphoribosyltransferase [Candidatus Woesearchaeota archaeon CG10_big_fil_rev_8_21_14_0_10_45_16]